jgi:hypothetical protein
VSSRRVFAVVAAAALLVAAALALAPTARMATGPELAAALRTDMPSAPTASTMRPARSGGPSKAPAAPVGSMTRALAYGEALRPLFDERLACARSGDADCQWDVWLAWQHCGGFAQRDPATEQRRRESRAMLAAMGTSPEAIALHDERAEACAGFDRSASEAVGNPTEWQHRAFHAGQPSALMEAASDVGVLASDPSTFAASVVESAPYPPYRPGVSTIPSAFLPAGPRDPPRLREHALALASQALASGRAETLMAAGDLYHLLRDDTDRDELQVTRVAWYALACDAGHPCASDTRAARNLCAFGGCREPLGIVEVFSQGKGVDFPAKVRTCADRIAAALARGDRAGALMTLCT